MWASRIREVQRRLRAEQGAFAPKPVLPVIDEVVATVLSQHTSDINSGRAFAQLKEKFSSWEQVAAAPAGQVADAIRCGGIADQKARRIQQILAAICEREGRIDLGHLHDLGDTAAGAYLESLPGVGPKTAACVLTFAMGRAAFPVDTHVHRVATRLGWLPAEDRRGQGTPAARADGARRHPVRPARRDDQPWADCLPGAAATLRHVRTERSVRLPAAERGAGSAELRKCRAPPVTCRRDAGCAVRFGGTQTQRRRVVSCSICDSFSGLRTAYSPVMRPSSMRTARTVSISPLSRRISAG